MMVSKETLVVAKNQAGYFGVRLANPGYPKPYQARVKRSGRDVQLGCFATVDLPRLVSCKTYSTQFHSFSEYNVPPTPQEVFTTPAFPIYLYQITAPYPHQPSPPTCIKRT